MKSYIQGRKVNLFTQPYISFPFAPSRGPELRISKHERRNIILDPQIDKEEMDICALTLFMIGSFLLYNYICIIYFCLLILLLILIKKNK